MILGIYQQSASGTALVRTTMVPTIFNAGKKDNVVPQYARAVINLRLLPGDTLDLVMDHVRSVIDNDAIEIKELTYVRPSKVSPTGTRAYEIIERSIKEVFPETLVSPSLVIGGTDARHYNLISDQVYRFVPYHLDAATLKGFHGINERVAIRDFEDGIRFYRRLMQAE